MGPALNRHLPWLRAAFAGWIAFGVGAVCARGQVTPYNNFVWLARAFVHGRVAIDFPGEYIDALPYHGAHYVIEGPFPTVLLMPWVAIFGDANQTLLALVLGAVAVACCWLTCEHLGVARRSAAWICAFLFLGTSLCWCAMLGDVWFLAHAAAVACTFAALAELTGRRRGWLVALFAAGAAYSRFTLVLALPVYAYLLLSERERRDQKAALIGFALVILAAAVLWVLYNESRWQVWYDIGYTEWYHFDQLGAKTGGPFQLRFFPAEWYAFFRQGADRIATFPYFVPTRAGLALSWTSPALLLALFARGPRRLIIAMWLAALLTAGPNFVYYASGYAQWGMRHALDFEPFLIVVMALAVRERMTLAARLLIGWSVVVGCWGIWYWLAAYRT